MKAQNNKDFDYESNIMGVGTIDFLSIYSPHRFNFEEFCSAVKYRRGKLIEIGCGAGVFLYNIAKYIPDLELYGCDISNAAIKAAKDTTPNTNIHYFVGDGSNLPINNNSFDIVILMDVLEHISDVNKLLNECNRILKIQGMLHANIPCEKNRFTIWWFMEKIGLGKNLTRKHLGHIQKLTIDEVIQLINCAGFEVQSISYSRHLFGQLVALFGFFLPKEILTRLFGKTTTLALSDYAINTTKVQNQSWILKGLLLFREIWFFIFKLFAAISYFESVILRRKRFLATDMHITCIKKGDV
ncbi:MAG: class I SAM-dependent methyltransferase [bacterium]|nr:class I SAM-dependent methyltransferase [bacterium]